MPSEKELTEIVAALAEKFEEFSGKFIVAFETREFRGPARWYTVKGLALRLLRIGANIATAPEAQAACVILHGAIDVLGFSATLKLVAELRRKHASKQGK